MANDTPRLLAIGDIHGCLERLLDLLEAVDPQPDDQVIFLGDYIDRGPESCQVIDFLIEFSKEFPSTIFLRGNHEQMFLDFLTADLGLGFLLNGGQETLDSYERLRRFPPPQDHLAFLNGLKIFWETEQYIFVHAGLRPGLPLEEQVPEDCLWIRREFMESSYDWGKVVVFGHTPLSKPLLTPSRIGLDAGAVYGGQLVCCDVLQRALWFA